MFKQDVPANTEALQRGINRLSTARTGPVSVGPGDGHQRFYDANGKTLFMLDSDGARVVHRGDLSDLTGILDDNADLNDTQNSRLTGHDNDVTRIDAKNSDQDGRLSGHDSTLASHGNRLGSAEGRLDGHDSTLSSHAGRLGSAEGRLDGHDGTLSSHNTRISTAQGTANGAQSSANAAQSSANSAQSRADSAYSRAGTGISNAATAQSRADAAYSLAAGAASPGDVSTMFDVLAGRITQLTARVKALEDWKATLPGA